MVRRSVVTLLTFVTVLTPLLRLAFAGNVLLVIPSEVEESLVIPLAVRFPLRLELGENRSR